MNPPAFPFERRRASRAPCFAPSQTWHCRNGRCLALRPTRASDVVLAHEFFSKLTPLSRYRRFHSPCSLRHTELELLTRVDYPRRLALIATAAEHGGETQVGTAHLVRNESSEHAEFAVVVADAWQGLGIGEKLLVTLAEHASAAGILQGTGLILASNIPMLHMVRKLGARLSVDPEDPATYRFSMVLR